MLGMIHVLGAHTIHVVLLVVVLNSTGSAAGMDYIVQLIKIIAQQVYSVKIAGIFSLCDNII